MPNIVETLQRLQEDIEAAMKVATTTLPNLGWTVVLAAPIDEMQIHTWCSSTMDERFLEEVLNAYHSKALDKNALVN